MQLYRTLGYIPNAQAIRDAAEDAGVIRANPAEAAEMAVSLLWKLQLKNGATNPKNDACYWWWSCYTATPKSHLSILPLDVKV